MFKLVRIEVLGYKDFVYKLVFECSDIKFIYDKFKLNARRCSVNNVSNSYSIIAEVESDKLFKVINIGAILRSVKTKLISSSLFTLFL